MAKVDFGPYVGPTFRMLRDKGCSAVLGRSPRRVHTGYDESAWSKPMIVVYGVDLPTAEKALRGLGWRHDISVS